MEIQYALSVALVVLPLAIVLVAVVAIHYTLAVAFSIYKLADISAIRVLLFLDGGFLFPKRVQPFPQRRIRVFIGKFIQRICAQIRPFGGERFEPSEAVFRAKGIQANPRHVLQNFGPCVYKAIILIQHLLILPELQP